MEGPSPSEHASTARADDNAVGRLNAENERLRQQLAAANLKIEQYEANRLQMTAAAQPVHHHEAVASTSVCFVRSLCASFHIDVGIECLSFFNVQTVAALEMQTVN